MTVTDLFSTEPSLAVLVPATQAALALTSSGERLIAATASGAPVFGVVDSHLPRKLAEQVSRLASQVSSGAPRLVRLRLGGLLPVTVKAQRVRLSDGSGALVLVALDAPRRRVDTPPETPDAIPVIPHNSLPPDPMPAEDQRPGEEMPPVEAEAPAPTEAVDEPQAKEVADRPADKPLAPVDIPPSPPEDKTARPEAEIVEPEHVEPAQPKPEAEPTVAARRPLRFVWQTDEAGVLGLVSPEFAAAIQRDADDLVGQRWTDLAGELGFDGEGKLHRALSRRDTWSGVTVDWPLDDGRLMPVDLAGLPVFDRERNFKGFRGFGVCHEPVAKPEAPLGGAVEPEPAPVTARVVLFPEPKEPARPQLSSNDRHALREIARALGAPAPDKVVPVATRRGSSTLKAVAKGEAAAESAETPPAAASAAPSPHAGPASPLDAEAPQPSAEAIPARLEPVADRRADLIEALPYAVLVHRGGVPIYANRAFADLSGYATIDELAAAGVDALFSQTNSSMAITRADGLSLPVECHLKQIDWEGDPATLLTFRVHEPAPLPEPSEKPMFEPNDTPAMAEMARRVRELTAILDTATDGVVVLDADGRILSVNRSAEALFGYESAELTGRSLTLLLSTESHNAALDYLDGMRANGVASLLNDGREVIGIARRGGSIPLFMTLGRLDDDAGAKFCAVLRDITQFKKAEEELRSSKTQAESMSAQKSDFLARISHEIRTPLNAILGFAEVMMEERFGPIGTERYRDYLRDIHLSGQHVISLVNDLLDLSKIEAGRLDLAFTSLQLNDVVTTAVGLMQPQANNAKVIVRTSLAARLPAVVADERSLRQIALNLLSNAIKFTPPGGQVIISTALTDLGQAVIRVRDTGIGMSEKDIQAALEPFRQIASSGRGDGTGLGLPLTKALTEANRATFAIQSASGSGTLVEVIFPPTRVLAE